MSTVTAATAARVADRTAVIVAKFRADADAAEKAGDLTGAAALRTLADSRERAGARVRVGANIRAAR